MRKFQPEIISNRVSKVELPGVSTGCFDSDRGDLSFDSVPKAESPGVSTGCFDSDRGDLSFDSVPKVESPGEGFVPRSVASKSLAGA